MIKLTIYSLFIVLSLNNARALDFEKGSAVDKEVHPRLLRNVLRGGNDSVKGIKIVISKDAEIPKSFENKWSERKLSGASIPETGEPSDDVIFIKSF